MLLLKPTFSFNPSFKSPSALSFKSRFSSSPCSTLISLFYCISGFYISALKVFQTQQFLTTHNKFAKLAHYVRWTAAHLHKCGFAAQNFTTLVQIHSSRLQRRYE